MSKFNITKPKVVPTTINEMGEKAYQMTAKEDLLATCLTTFLTSSYYESETEIVNRIKSAIGKVDEEFVAKFALYLRRDANMRSVTHLLSGELAPRLSGKEYASRFYQKVAQRPDDMSEILAYYFSKGNRKIANSIKRGFKMKLESMDPYLIDKYKMTKKEISLVDLVNLMHPKGTQANAEAYKRLMAGESLDGLYTSKIFEKEMTKAGKIAKETGVDVKETKKEAITSVLDNVQGMPMMNLVRNLRNILTLAPEKVDEAVKQLTTKGKVLNSKLLPFRFVSAYTEIEAVGVKTYNASEIVFESDVIPNMAELKAKILQGLETALEYSVENIPALEGNTAVLVDHSGSVRGDGGGSSRVSAFSKTTTAMIGNLFGSMLAYSQRDVYVGLFGDRLISVPMDRTKGMLNHNKESFQKASNIGMGTENGLYIFLDEAIRNKTKVDNLVIFSDMVIGKGGQGGWDMSSRAGLGTFQQLFKAFKHVNPMCNTVCVNMRATGGKSVFNKALNVTEVAGWSDKIFNQIEANCKGYEDLIKEIEAIKL
jgi:60 kDa SS-A/Ro ribonucleoprotein